MNWLWVTEKLWFVGEAASLKDRPNQLDLVWLKS